MQDKFIKKRHILEYEDKQLINVKLGITTREDGLSPYPQNAFNMARY
ncbi:laccase, partial [Staphylococcus saprophyticus]|nr:laccase [Staphylococcus saprophyticus]